MTFREINVGSWNQPLSLDYRHVSVHKLPTGDVEVNIHDIYISKSFLNITLPEERKERIEFIKSIKLQDVVPHTNYGPFILSNDGNQGKLKRLFIDEQLLDLKGDCEITDTVDIEDICQRMHRFITSPTKDITHKL